MGITVFALLSYLLGSLSFALLVSRLFALPDPRTYGSGNPGATNVLRTGRKAAAALTLIGDGAKGWLAVFIAQHYADAAVVDGAMASAAAAAVLGHMYPLYHRFKGGKGVATALGALIGLNIYLALCTAATWIIMAVFFRISSLAALVSALFAPFFAIILYNVQHPFVWSVAFIALMLVWRHKANIKNLLAGKESRLGARAAEPSGEGN